MTDKPSKPGFFPVAFSIFIPGIPKPGGSKRFVGKNKKTGKAVLIDMSGPKGTAWRDRVASFIQVHMRDSKMAMFPKGVALHAAVRFYMPRPKHHFKASGEQSKTWREYHISPADATKLWRSAEDSLKGIIIHDDSQIASQDICKIYANDQPGMWLSLSIIK